MKKRLALKVAHRVHSGARYPMKTMLAAARRLQLDLMPYTVHQVLVFEDGHKGRTTLNLYHFGKWPEPGDIHPVEKLTDMWWADEALTRVVKNSPDSP